MDKEGIITWVALEYEEKDRSIDWFWALGIIIVASAITAIIYGNYFFAVLLALGGTLAGVFAYRKPRMIPYEMGGKGIKILDRFYAYKDMKSFFVQEGDGAPMLLIKTDRYFMPMISLPIESLQAVAIKAKMLSHEVPEEEMREHISVKIMDRLGF